MPTEDEYSKRGGFESETKSKATCNDTLATLEIKLDDQDSPDTYSAGLCTAQNIIS